MRFRFDHKSVFKSMRVRESDYGQPKAIELKVFCRALVLFRPLVIPVFKFRERKVCPSMYQAQRHALPETAEKLTL